MDRQKLLHEKRLKLQELRRKRINGNVRELEETKGETEHDGGGSMFERKQINVGIQVNNEENELSLIQWKCETLDAKQQETDKSTRFSKAVQTQSEDEFEETEVENAQSTDEFASISRESSADNEPVSEDVLNAELKDSFRFLNRVVAQESMNSAVLADMSKILEDINRSENHISLHKKHAFSEISGIPPIKGRMIVDIDYLSHLDGILVAAYKEGPKVCSVSLESEFQQSLYQSSGLAILYNIKCSKPFPEFFLHASSSISIVKFDKNNPSRIIGGLENGKIVIWDIKNNSNNIAILPTLESPSWFDISPEREGHTQGHKFINHEGRIIFIDQLPIDNNECIVSISDDGIINVWSSSMLAKPKLSSIVLRKKVQGTSSMELSLHIVTAIILKQRKIEKSFLLDDDLATNKPEYNFLDRIVVGCGDGSILKLSNRTEDGFIEEILFEDKDESYKACTVTSLSLLDSTDENSMIVASRLDWSLKVLETRKKRFIGNIITCYLASKIVARPGYMNQFISIGTSTQSHEEYLSPVIEVWDLTQSLFDPVYQEDIKNLCGPDLPPTFNATAARLDTSGSTLLVGFDNGMLINFRVDAPMIDQLLIESEKNKGKNSYFKSMPK